MSSKANPAWGKSTSQVDEMAKKVNEPGMYASIPNSDMYPPHKFEPKTEGAIGSPCKICGGGPEQVQHGILKVDHSKALGLLEEPAVWRERVSPDSVTYEIRNIPNDQAMRIVQDILPKALELYLKKSKDYGGNVMDRFGLGQRAAIPDMARKFGKLIDSIWHGKKLQFEQEDEILQDLLGHILIILDQRAEGK